MYTKDVVADRSGVGMCRRNSPKMKGNVEEKPPKSSKYLRTACSRKREIHTTTTTVATLQNSDTSPVNSSSSFGTVPVVWLRMRNYFKYLRHLFCKQCRSVRRNDRLEVLVEQ